VYVVLGAHRGEHDGYIDDNAIVQVVNSSDFVIIRYTSGMESRNIWRGCGSHQTTRTFKFYRLVSSFVRLSYTRFTDDFSNFTDRIGPICLAPIDDPDHVNDSVIVSGWGSTGDGMFNHNSQLK